MAFNPSTRESAPGKKAAATVVETAPKKEVYVEGEPIPEGVLPAMQDEKAAPQESAPVPRKTPEQAIAEVHPPKDELQKKIEKALEVDLTDEITSMTPVEREAFIVTGEETAWKVRHQLTAPKLDAKQVRAIVDSIKGWLKMIPNANSSFIEQVAKNQVDALLALRGDT